MKVAVSTTMFCGGLGYAELPEGKTWDDVETWHIKWDNLNLLFKDGSTASLPLESEVNDGIDWKRPLSATIHPVSDEDVTDYDTELDSKD